VQQCELWQSWRQENAEMDELEWPLNTETLRNNIAKVTNFFELRVTPLRERIEKKKEEVTSLQDAVCEPLLPHTHFSPRRAKLIMHDTSC
jgi:hypothetical protein